MTDPHGTGWIKDFLGYKILIPERLLLQVTIPGTVQGQARARHRLIRKPDGTPVGQITHDDPKNKTWKALAQDHYSTAARKAERSGRGPFPITGPFALVVFSYKLMPRSTWRKTSPRPEKFSTSKPDGDNILKAVLDAGTSLLWLDDKQCAAPILVKRQAAQGEPARLKIWVYALED